MRKKGLILSVNGFLDFPLNYVIDPKNILKVPIKRARKAYEPYPDTKNINTNFIPLAANATAFVFDVFSVHEVRNREERIHFLQPQHRFLMDGGYCIIVEHLRLT